MKNKSKLLNIFIFSIIFIGLNSFPTNIFAEEEDKENASEEKNDDVATNDTPIVPAGAYDYGSGKVYTAFTTEDVVEGGTKTIQSFIDADLWDEARRFIGKNQICEGVKSPIIKNTFFEKKNISDDILLSYINY